MDEDTVIACSMNSFKGKLQKMKDNSDSLYLDTDRPMNSYGQASWPGKANPVSYLCRLCYLHID